MLVCDLAFSWYSSVRLLSRDRFLGLHGKEIAFFFSQTKLECLPIHLSFLALRFCPSAVTLPAVRGAYGISFVVPTEVRFA